MSSSSASRQRLFSGQRFSRHRHGFAYAAVVLCGAYREAGGSGRARHSGGAHFGVANIDEIARIAENNSADLEHELLHSLVELPAPAWDWPDLLAADLRRNAVPSLSAWSADHGLTPHSLSRGFPSVFGATPKRFGLECKAHAALRRVAGGSTQLSAIAADAGFADQAHMTRAVSELTGSPPSYWRA